MGRMTPPVSFVWKVIAATLLPLPIAHAAPAVKVLSIDAVPGLSNYLTKRFQTGWKTKRHVFLVRLLELDEEPDGIDEILLSVDKFDAEFCNNSGCDHEVLLRLPNGGLKAVASFRGFGLQVADTYTNGVRDLVSETIKGNRRFNLAGETSGTLNRKKPGKNMKDVKLKSGVAPIL